MSITPKKGTPGWIALSHLWQAEAHARSGSRASYESHIKRAHVQVGEHVKHLTTQGEHDQAIHFNTAAQKYLKRLEAK